MDEFAGIQKSLYVTFSLSVRGLGSADFESVEK